MNSAGTGADVVVLAVEEGEPLGGGSSMIDTSMRPMTEVLSLEVLRDLRVAHRPRPPAVTKVSPRQSGLASNTTLDERRHHEPVRGRSDRMLLGTCSPYFSTTSRATAPVAA
jgi:hypothetical protein